MLPATAAWCETDGTTTNSERRVQRVRKALDPPGEARDDIDIICDLAAPARATTGSTTDAEDVWDELRVAVARPLGHDATTGWRSTRASSGPAPAPRTSSNPRYLHGRLWETDPAARGRPAPFAASSSTTRRST